jgi:hypothetical protein
MTLLPLHTDIHTMACLLPPTLQSMYRTYTNIRQQLHLPTPIRWDYRTYLVYVRVGAAAPEEAPSGLLGCVAPARGGPQHAAQRG